jgi:hypothetical protein
LSDRHSANAKRKELYLVNYLLIAQAASSPGYPFELLLFQVSSVTVHQAVVIIVKNSVANLPTCNKNLLDHELCNKNELWQLSDQNSAAKNGAFRSPKMVFLCRMFLQRSKAFSI